MLDNLKPLNVIFINLILMILWHLIILFLCRILPDSFFNPNKFLYRKYNWEKNGNFYVKKLKIKKWKDKLPQYVAKDGFSKRNLNSINPNDSYINTFIMETCRAEWNHFMCSMYAIISFAINTFSYALIFSVIPIVANLPFLIIQRYNRIRLSKLNTKKATV